VPRFLSPPWVEEFNRLVATVDVPEPDDDAVLAVRDGSFSLRQVVTGGPEGETVRTIRVDGGRVRMETDVEATPEPDVTVALTWEDAVALSLGTFSPADALATGRIRVRGDLGVLAAGQAVLAAAAASLEPLRADTTY
jgi:hypothetical protein